ncbi:hypothetical protein Tco_1225993 [Tanacetum coccineum]
MGISRHSYAEVVKKTVKVSDVVRRRKNDLPHGDNGWQKDDSYNAHKYDDQSGCRQDQFDGNVCMYYTTRHEDTELLQSCLVAMVKEAATLKFLSDDIVSESKFGNKISVVGVPVKAFSIGFFVELSNQWGSFIAVDDLTLYRHRLDVARVSLSTSLKSLPKTCLVDIDDDRMVTLSIKEDLRCILLPIPYLNSHQAEEDILVMAEGGHSGEVVEYNQDGEVEPNIMDGDEYDSNEDVNYHQARTKEPPVTAEDGLHSSCGLDRHANDTDFEKTVPIASPQP